MSEAIEAVNQPNLWRLETPGHLGWRRTARPGDPDKYLMISADSHCNEPSNLWYERIDREFRDRLPRIEIDENGVKWQISEGWQRSRLLDSVFEGEDRVRAKAGAEPAHLRHVFRAGWTARDRLRSRRADDAARGRMAQVEAEPRWRMG